MFKMLQWGRGRRIW